MLIGASCLPNASQAAAGIVNPVTGRWMTKSWRIEQLLPEARATYREIEANFGERIFHPVPARRYFQNEEDARRAARRARNPRYADVLGPPLPPGADPNGLNDPAGSIRLEQAHWVDLPRLLERLRGFFASIGCFRDEVFRYDALQRQAAGWSYGDLRAGRVVFCEGARLRANPWFGRLPLKPIKGETLRLQLDGFNLTRGIYHGRKWLLAYGDGACRLGATYDEADLSEAPTEAGRTELLADAGALLPPTARVRIEARLAGLRPSSPDSRPMLGAHPELPGLFVFNGLGSKGAGSAPWLSRQLLDHLRSGVKLDPEVDLRRFLGPPTCNA